MTPHRDAVPLPAGSGSSGYATYMSHFGTVQTSGAVHGRIRIRLGAFLAVPVLLVLLIRGVPLDPLLTAAMLSTLTAAGSFTYRRAKSHRS